MYLNFGVHIPISLHYLNDNFK